mmetsp:Transcript_24/g.63  ORF Transcript_24/g.63 Transcript_24/m.63 type:complete len:462 (+) Transcript_24:208-1593(+)
MRHHRRLLLLAASPALSFSVNTSSWSIHPASKRLFNRPVTTTSQSIISAEASSLRTKDISHVKQLSRQLYFCQTNNNNKFLSTIGRRRLSSGTRKNGRTDQRKRNMNMSSHDNTPQPPNPQPLMQQDDFEQFNGARTKFGRRERRTTDKMSNNARVRNSYLKLIMEDDAVYDQLHNLVCQTSHQWQQENNANTIDQKKISKKQSKRQLTIHPRNRNSLHMTFFFAGKVLEDMTSEELQRWEYFVRKCVLEHSANDGLFSEGDYSLRFKSLVTFPPNRQNLIVAVFESSLALDDLYEKLCGVAVMEKEESKEKRKESNANDEAIASTTVDGGKDCEFPLLRELTQKQQKIREQHKSPGWIAHVTLGSLVGGSREDVRRLSEWLGNRNYADDIAVDATDDTAAFTSPPLEVTSKTSSESKNAPLTKTEKTSCLLESNIGVLGLALGGPVPGHVDIDWDFPLKL